MKRISIVGPPGGGKTTFARALSTKINIPVVHLDGYFLRSEPDYMNNKQAWSEKVQELVAEESWIIEGNYGTSYQHRMPRSDTVIFLDTPQWLSTYSVLKRRLQYRKKKRPETPDDWVERIDPAFFKYVITFKKKSRGDVVDGIEKYRRKDMNVLIFKSRKSAYTWMNGLKV